jgi:signal peptidase I
VALLGTVLALATLWGALRLLFEGWYVKGDAMAPTYHHGDLLLGYKFAYGEAADVQRGDVVVVRLGPRGLDEYQVWRVAGLPGGRFQRSDGSAMELRAGEYFLRGDAPFALDSRSFGPVPFERIQFKIIGRLTKAHPQTGVRDVEAAQPGVVGGPGPSLRSEPGR